MNNIKLFFLLCAFVGALQSCSLYGKYQAQAPEADTIAIPAYTDIFRDTNLQHLIQVALAQNLDLKIAREHVAQADASLLGAKLAYIPSLYVGGSPVAQYPSFTGHTFATASWEIDIFGRLTNQKRMAQATQKQMLDYEQAARVELIAAVAQTYFTLQMLDAQILTNDSAEANWKRSVEAMRDMKQAGMTDEAAVAQFEGSYFATMAQGSNLRLQRDQAENAMRLLLSMEMGAIKRSVLDTTAATNNLLSSVNLQATLARPDVKAVEHQLEYAFYGANLARANCCPSISIGGTIGWANGGLIYNLIGNLLQPIFNSGRNIAEVRAANSRVQEQQWAYANVLLKAGNEVNDALLERRAYTEQTQALYHRVQALERALDATQTKMSLGRGTYLEVLTAQNDLLNAQFSLIANYCNILLSDIHLYHAIGGGK